LEAGFFRIDKFGFVQSPLLPPPRQEGARHKLFQLFWHSKNGRFLFREGVCHLAAVSALVLDYGWPSDQVRLSPNRKDLGKFAYGVDFLVFDRPGGEPMIFGEAKNDHKSLKKMIGEVTECARMGPHERTDCGRSQHPKFAALWHKRASLTHFWAVCPGIQEAFALEFTGGTCTLTRVEDIPRASQ
jgi:hypothetical protein